MQHCRYELLIFDLDGTLLNTGEALQEAAKLFRIRYSTCEVLPHIFKEDKT